MIKTLAPKDEPYLLQSLGNLTAAQALGRRRVAAARETKDLRTNQKLKEMIQTTKGIIIFHQPRFP